MYFSVKSQHQLSPLYFTKKENVGKWILEQSKKVWNENHPTRRLDYIVIDIIKGDAPNGMPFQDENMNVKKEKKELTPEELLEKLNMEIHKLEEKLKKKQDEYKKKVVGKSSNLG